MLFSLFIGDLPASLPSSVGCSLCAGGLAIWSSSPLVPTVVGALFRLEHWCLPLGLGKCKASFFSVDPHQAGLWPSLLLLSSHLRFNLAPAFLGVAFDYTLSFSGHVSLLETEFFSHLRALHCVSASSWGPSGESLSLLYESFLRSLLTCALPGWFPFLSAASLTGLGRLCQVADRAIAGCLSSYPIPLLFSEASLPSLQVTLTHFTLFSYEWALRLPTSFSISGLARLGVKPRVCRSSWRALASTHLLMLPSTSSRGALLACPPCPWNLLSFTVESTLSTACSCSDPPSLARVQLSSTLTLSPLMIWCFGQTALFLFLLARAALAFLPSAVSVALRPLFPFRPAQYAQVFPLEPTPFCTLFAGLGSTKTSAISLLFSYYLTLVLFLPPCRLLHLSSYLKLCGRSGRNCLLSPVLSGCNGSQDTHFYRETMRMISWPDGEHCLRPPLSFVVFLFLSLVATLVLSRTGGVLSHLNSLTHRFPQFPLRNLCSFVMLAVSSLVFAAMDTAFC